MENVKRANTQKRIYNFRGVWPIEPMGCGGGGALGVRVTNRYYFMISVCLPFTVNFKPKRN